MKKQKMLGIAVVGSVLLLCAILAIAVITSRRHNLLIAVFDADVSLRFGETMDQVKAKLGAPEEIIPAGSKYRHTSWEYHNISLRGYPAKVTLHFWGDTLEEYYVDIIAEDEKGARNLAEQYQLLVRQQFERNYSVKEYPAPGADGLCFQVPKICIHYVTVCRNEDLCKWIVQIQGCKSHYLFN